MARKPKIERFKENVLSKFQIYNSLFLTLPFDSIRNTSVLIPLFSDHCKNGYDQKLDPREITTTFFSRYLPEYDEKEQIDLLFRFIQYIERQVVLFDSIEDAAFGLTSIGDVSEIIETSFGFHIIKLTDRKAVETKAFSSIADEIYNILKTEAATTEFYELQSAMAALAFELPDELEELATTLEKTVASSTLFTRSAPPAELADTQILNAAFSLELIEDRVNSELIELSDEHVIVVRVEEHQPVRTRTFDEVSSEVTVALTQELSLEQAEAWMTDIQARLQAGESVDSLLTEQSIAWVEENGVERFSTVLANDLKTQLFKATLDSYELVSAGDSISLLQLLNINDVETTDPEAVESMRQRIVMSASQRTLQSFIELLKTEAVIQRFDR